MAKTVSFTYDGFKYTLGFDRSTAVFLEQQGFNYEAIGEKPNTLIPMLFYGSFAKYHKGIKRNLVDKIFEALPNKQALIAVLVEAYLEVGNTLFDEPDGESGNVTWEQNG